MEQVSHTSARTTEATRRAIPNSQESVRALAARYEINTKIMAKTRKCKGCSHEIQRASIRCFDS